MSQHDHDEPVWLTEVQIRMLHAEAINLFGGARGIRDPGLLESALNRPRHLWTYQQSVTLHELAAAYGFGIAKNHAFADGNKRVALLAIRAFLFRNGHKLIPDEVETVTVIEGLASGSVSEVDLAAWIVDNSEPRQVDAKRQK